MKTKISNISERIISIGLVILLLMMPFHAFLSVTIGYFGADRLFVQSWKEVLILLMGLAWLSYCLSKGRIAFRTDATNMFFISIIALSILITAIVHPNASAVLYGIKTNLVAIGLFFIAQTPMPSKSFLKKYLYLIVIIPGLIVAVLAILQGLVIPPTLLERIGYNASSINPRQIVDGSLSFYRAFSTLGGPNQLGAYLIVPLVFCIIYAVKMKSWLLAISNLPILAGIYFSYSRSAWIGALLAILIALLIILNKKQRIVFATIALAVLVLTGVFVWSQLGKGSSLENVLLHGRYFENRIEGSDQNRLQALTNATEAVQNRPFGHGLGSAGPASFQSEAPFISENWYLQIAYEIGIIGLILYIFAFTGLLGDFYRNLRNPLAACLFTITISVLVINLFLHAWADSTLVIIMFGLYGIYKSRTA